MSALLAAYLAGAFVCVAVTWLETGPTLSDRQMVETVACAVLWPLMIPMGLVMCWRAR